MYCEATMKKHYKLESRDLQPLATGFGLCVVTDRIAVDGYAVGYMYRDEPEDGEDSGWRFFAGDEDDRYIDNPKNFNVMEVNFVANCDPSIIAHLESPIGAAFDKADDGDFYDVSE